MASGSFNLSCNNTMVSVWCSWYEQNVNISNNTSELVVQVYLKRVNNGYTTYGTINTTVTADSASQSENGLSFSNNGTANSLVFSKIFTINHSDDGSKAFTLSASYDGNVINGSGSANITLDTIPRKSQITLSKSEFNIGESVTIYTNRKSSSFTHSLYLKRADGYYYDPVATKITDNYNINTADINNLIYKQCVNAKYYNGQFLLRTFNGSTNLGDTIVAFKANVTNSNPTVGSVSYTVLNQDESNQEIVQYNSDIEVNFSDVSPQKQASISKYIVLCGGTQYSSASSPIKIENVSGEALSCWVIDSRGFESSEKSLTLSNYYPYSSPQISNLKVSRIESDTEEDEGKVGVSFKINISEIAVLKANNKVYYSYKPAMDSGEFCDSIELFIPSKTESEVSLTLNEIFAIDQNFILKFTVEDSFSTKAAKEILLQTAMPELSIRKDRVGINCIPIEGEGNFQINGKNFVNLVYPIGSIYMSVNSTDPSTLFDGTNWVRISKGKAIVGIDEDDSDFSSVGNVSIGEKKHTLTVSELAQHSHTASSSTGLTAFLRVVALAGGSCAANHTVGYSSGSYTDFSNGATGFPGANHYHNITVNNSGSNSGHNNVQPSFAVYIWQRTA